MTSPLTDFILDCGKRQVELFNYSEEPMTRDEFANYWRTHVLACLDEVHELLDCVDWKPWSEGEGRIKVDKEVITSEVADILVFLGNLCFAAGISHGQLERQLELTDIKIRRRVAEGYEARRRIVASS